MTASSSPNRFDRRTVLKGAAAATVLQAAPPFIIGARGETPLRIGMVDPLTGVYAAVAQNEVMGAKRSNCWSRIRRTTSARACRRRAS